MQKLIYAKVDICSCYTQKYMYFHLQETLKKDLSLESKNWKVDR